MCLAAKLYKHTLWLRKSFLFCNAFTTTTFVCLHCTCCAWAAIRDLVCCLSSHRHLKRKPIHAIALYTRTFLLCLVGRTLWASLARAYYALSIRFFATACLSTAASVIHTSSAWCRGDYQGTACTPSSTSIHLFLTRLVRLPISQLSAWKLYSLCIKRFYNAHRSGAAFLATLDTPSRVRFTRNLFTARETSCASRLSSTATGRPKHKLWVCASK